MTHTLPAAETARRSTLLGVVIGFHVAVFLLAFTVRSVAPQLKDLPLVVDLLPGPAAKEPEAKPMPVVRPQPLRPQAAPAPRQQSPLLEATRSSVPAAEAATASPPDTRPSPPAEPTVTQPRFDADYLKNPAPPYPPLSRRAGEQGKVVLRVAVTAQGTAEHVEVRTSSGRQRLDDAALATVRNWRFVPARRGDLVVPSWVLVPIIFKLEQ